MAVNLASPGAAPRTRAEARMLREAQEARTRRIPLPGRGRGRGREHGDHPRHTTATPGTPAPSSPEPTGAGVAHREPTRPRRGDGHDGPYTGHHERHGRHERHERHGADDLTWPPRARHTPPTPAGPTTTPATAPAPAATRRGVRASDRLPYLPLLLMAAAGFVTMMTEALPVAVMPSMRAATGWSDGTIGQLVTAYGIGCGVAAIPMTLLTRGIDRRPLVLATTAVFVVTNVATALTTSLPVMLAARVVAGCCAGLLWAVLAGYATRLVDAAVAGRAMALAMLGTPLALALGIPLGSRLGDALGWRDTVLAVSGAAGVVLVLGLLAFPSAPGERGDGDRPGVLAVLALPGLACVLAATALFATAHNLVYTYLPSLLVGRPDLPLQALLLTFGVGAVAGLMLVGRHVDAHLGRLARLTLTALVVVLLAHVTLPSVPAPGAWALAALWGLVFGGAPTIFQTASARICGPSQDVGQALVVTTWNVCVAVAGALGGALVDAGRPGSLPVVGAVLAAVGLQAVAVGGFAPAVSRRVERRSAVPAADVPAAVLDPAHPAGEVVPVHLDAALLAAVDARAAHDRMSRADVVRDAVRRHVG